MPQSLSKLWVHIIFSTKGRDPFLNEKVCSKAHAYMAGILKNLGALVGEIGGTEDHVHILCCLPRTLSLAQLVEEVKKSSSQKMKANGITNFFGRGVMAVFPSANRKLKPSCVILRSKKSIIERFLFRKSTKTF